MIHSRALLVSDKFFVAMEAIVGVAALTLDLTGFTGFFGRVFAEN